MMKKWSSPMYAFFSPRPNIIYVAGRRVHSFKCLAKGCKYEVKRYLDTKDATSTGNMSRHVASCWGKEAYDAAKSAKNADDVRTNITEKILQNTAITTFFDRKDKGKVTYSHRQHTVQEARAEIVRWICESVRPFRIVGDRGFQSLMKTGRPGYVLPSASTVARDVRQVFAKTRTRIGRMLEVCTFWLDQIYNQL